MSRNHRQLTIALFFLLLLTTLLGACSAIAHRDEWAGLQALVDVDLSTGPFTAQTLAQFTLQDSAEVVLYMTLKDVDTTYFDLRLVMPEGDSLVILRGEDYRTDHEGGGVWQRRLGPGLYRLALTADESPGLLSVYWKQQ